MMLKQVAVLFFVFQCGVAFAHRVHSHKRIIGGVGAASNQFPYLVSVQKMEYNVLHIHVCGGALIKQNYVLTAAHCVNNNDTMEVRAGLVRIVNSRAPSVAIAERYIHPNFENITNDIAILKLATNFNLSSSIQLINLPPPNYVTSGNVVFSGWGTTNSSLHTFSNNAMFAILNVITLDQCERDILNSTGITANLTDGNICASSPTAYSCYRDDGGPLVQNTTLVGIATWPICDKKNAPSVFTNVSSYVQWINGIIL